MDTPTIGKEKKKVNNLIKFPTHKVRKPKSDLAAKQSSEEAKKIKENIFIEQLVEEFTLDLIHVLQENAVTMASETFLRDLAVIIESIKSLLKRDFGKQHPMQSITDSFINIATTKEGRKLTDINYGKILKVKKAKVKEPEKSVSIDFDFDLE